MNRTPASTLDVIVGSRREALHLAPIVHTFREKLAIETRLIAILSGQNQVCETLSSVSLQPDIQWTIRGTEQNSGTYLGEINVLLSELWSRTKADWLLIFGHNELTFASAVAAFQNRVPIAHIENNNICADSPVGPRHTNQSHRSISILSDLHFTCNSEMKYALIHDGIKEESIFTVGSTLIESSQRIIENISTEEFLKSLFNKFNSELVRKILDGQFFLFDLESCKYLNHLSDSIPAILSQSSELIPLIHAPSDSTRLNLQKSKLFEQVIMLDKLKHLQRCALLFKAACVLTDNDDTLEECSAFGTKGILIHERTNRSDLMSSGAASIADVRGNTLHKQIFSCKQEAKFKSKQICMRAVHSSAFTASHEILRAITSQTNESVEKEKIELLSQRAG